MKRSYTGDDKCPQCGAMYCADWPGDGIKGRPDPEDTVKCLGCGYTDKLDKFIVCFNHRTIAP